MTPTYRINIAMFLMFVLGGTGMYMFLNTTYGSEVDKSFQDMVNKYFVRENKPNITTVVITKDDNRYPDTDQDKDIFLATMAQKISDKNVDIGKF